ncbi:hypothetical protein KIPB_011356, partial [Kipferlia bialata]|eukprot:g11356.t1
MEAEGDEAICALMKEGAEFKVKTTDTATFEIVMDPPLPASTDFTHVRGGYVRRVKQPEEVSFTEWSEAIGSFQSNADTMLDLAHFGLDAMLHRLFLHADTHPYPAAWDEAAAKAWVAESGVCAEGDMFYDECVTFAMTGRGNTTGPCAFFGGLAAQEALKAVSGKYTPLKQFFYLSFFEALPSPRPSMQDAVPSENRYAGQVLVFGQQYQAEIARQKVFLVGAGALGCEIVKSMALMGVGVDEANGGKVYVTDPDAIEKSNLSRQFLFRESDIGRVK